MARTQKSKQNNEKSKKSAQSAPFELKSKLSTSQIKTIEKNCKDILHDTSLLKSLLEFMCKGIENEFHELTTTKKVVSAGAYLLINQLWKSANKAFIGFQNESQDRIIATLLSEDFQPYLQDALQNCKTQILRSLFIAEDVWSSTGEFESDIVEEGDEVFIYQPFGGGFAATAKAIVEMVKEDDQVAQMKNLKSMHDFFKVDQTEYPIGHLKLKTKAKDLAPKTSTFTSIKRGVLDLSTDSIFTSSKTSTTIVTSSNSSVHTDIQSTNSNVDTYADSDKDEEEDHDRSDSLMKKKTTPSTEPSSKKKKVSSSKEASSSNETVPSLSNPIFVKHYNELVESKLQLEAELAKYKRAVHTMNEMIKQMIKCVDDHEDVFQLADSIIQHGDNVLVLSHKERAEICSLGEKTAQIIHICTNHLKKSITKIDKSERMLIFKIIFDAMGWNIDKNSNKLSKYKAVFRTIKSKMKKEEENAESQKEQEEENTTEIKKGRKKASGGKKRGREVIDCKSDDSSSDDE